MNAQQNKQIIKQAYERFLRGDIRGVIEHCHDDAEWCSPESEFMPFSGSFRGKEAIADYFAKLEGTLQATRFEPRDFIADDDKVVVTGHASWVAKATGKAFDTPWAHVFTLRDGKLTRFEAYSDSAAGERAMRPDQGAQPSRSTQLHH